MKKHGKKENLKPIDNKSDAINEAKSNGQIEKRKEYNVRCHIRSFIEDKQALDVAFKTALKNAQNGKAKELIELIKLGCENETQKINLDGGVEVQKVFIDAETKKKTQEHIKDFIDGK